MAARISAGVLSCKNARGFGGRFRWMYAPITAPSTPPTTAPPAPIHAAWVVGSIERQATRVARQVRYKKPAQARFRKLTLMCVRRGRSHPVRVATHPTTRSLPQTSPTSPSRLPRSWTGSRGLASQPTPSRGQQLPRAGVAGRSLIEIGWIEQLSLRPPEPFVLGDSGYFDRSSHSLPARDGKPNKALGSLNHKSCQIDGVLYRRGPHYQGFVSMRDQLSAGLLYLLRI